MTDEQLVRRATDANRYRMTPPLAVSEMGLDLSQSNGVIHCGCLYRGALEFRPEEATRRVEPVRIVLYCDDPGGSVRTYIGQCGACRTLYWKVERD